jgi:hypothetical protein
LREPIRWGTDPTTTWVTLKYQQTTRATRRVITPKIITGPSKKSPLPSSLVWPWRYRVRPNRQGGN